MSNLTKLIQKNNLNSFEEVKDFLEKSPYNIEVREDKPVSNLYLLIYTDKSDINNEVVKECNGIILDKNSNKIVAYGFDRIYELKEADLINNFGDFCWDNATFKRHYDCPILKVFFYNGKWNVSTTKCINSSKSRWSSKKSFMDLFLECDVDFDNLNKEVCYSYAVRHPESRTVEPIFYKECFLLRERNMKTFEVVDYFPETIEFPKNNRFNFVKTLPFNNGLFIAEFKTGHCFKIESGEYEYVRKLRGNCPDMKDLFLEIIDDEELKSQLYRYYPEYSFAFDELEKRIVEVSKLIQNEYYINYVEKKEGAETFYKFRKTLKSLHSAYLKTKQPTTVQVVFDKLISLPAPVVKWIID